MERWVVLNISKLTSQLSNADDFGIIFSEPGSPRAGLFSSTRKGRGDDDTLFICPYRLYSFSVTGLVKDEKTGVAMYRER